MKRNQTHTFNKFTAFGTLLLAFAGLSTGCMSFSSMESALTLGEDNSEFVTGGGYTQYNVDGVGVSLPYVEVGYRYGVTDSTDVGVKYTFPGAIEFGGKHQVKKGEKLNVSVGGKLGYSALAMINSLSLTVPAYIGYSVNERFELIGTPQYRFINSSLSLSDADEYSATTHYIGTGIGARFGKEKGLLGELNFLVPVAASVGANGATESTGSSRESIVQLAIGFYLK